MRVAVTLWDGRISPVFDVCRSATLLEIEDREVVASRSVTLEAMPPRYRVGWLASLGVQTLICGAISTPLRQELEGQGITVLPFVSGELDEVVRAYLTGTLVRGDLAMPGCAGRADGGGHRRRERRGRGVRPPGGGA